MGNKDNHKIFYILKFGQIRPRTAELAAFERLENAHRLTIGEMSDQSSAFIFVWIVLILAGNKDSYKCLDEFEFW